MLPRLSLGLHRLISTKRSSMTGLRHAVPINTSASLGLSPCPKNITGKRQNRNKYLGIMSKEYSCFDENRMMYSDKFTLKQLESCTTMSRRHFTACNNITVKANGVISVNNYCANNQYICTRNYASRKKRHVTKLTDELDSDEEIDEDSDFENDDDDDDVDLLPKGWKTLVQVVPSLRLDTVLSSGLGLARKKIEDAFLENKLRVNNEKVSKKSRMVKVGETLDVIREEDGTVMRVIVLKIAKEKTSKDRVRVKLRRWKILDLKH